MSIMDWFKKKVPEGSSDPKLSAENKQTLAELEGLLSKVSSNNQFLSSQQMLEDENLASLRREGRGI